MYFILTVLNDTCTFLFELFHLFHLFLYFPTTHVVMGKWSQKHLITLTDFCGPTPAVNQMCNSTAALVCHVLHTAPCGVLQTEIEIVTWQQDPLVALRRTHLCSHLFIGLFE